jgi:hypothetical protein
LFFEIEAVSCDVHQLDALTLTHVIDASAGADSMFYQHLQLGIFWRAGKSKKGRFFAGDLQNCNLTGDKLDSVARFSAFRHKIERTYQAGLIANSGDD